MPTTASLLRKLEGTAPKPQLIVDDQQVKDIIKQMVIKTETTQADYDRIYKDFEGGSLLDICERLFDFCIDNIQLKTETEKKQYVSAPETILKRGTSDCKGYALFCGGVLDAMKRHGADIDWCYRFASYNFFDTTPYHVFVVANPKTDDIWIDPVLGTFNYHYGYWYKRDRKPKKVGAIGLIQPGFHQWVGPISATPTPTTSTLAPTNAQEMPFTGARSGVALPSIPGYPADLPQLQLSADGRLCFFNWPLWLSNPVWQKMGQNPIVPIDHPYSNTDWMGTYLKIATLEKITQAQYNDLKKEFTDGLDPFDFSLYNTSPGLAAGWYKRGQPYAWIFANVQFYIDKYLTNPYGVNDLIAYGTNWCDQFKTAMLAGTGKLTTYLEGVNFLVQPVGSQDFWDKFYLAAPLVITAIASIVSYGAATPALLAAIASLAVKYGEAKAAIVSAQTLTPQGTPQVNTSVVQQDIDTLTGQGGTINKVISWIKANPYLSVGIAAAIALLIYENDKK